MKRPMRKRAGFTLVELLVVLGIMLVLAIIGVGAAMKGFVWVQTMSTETTLRKIHERMARRYDQIVAEARGWDNNPNILRLANGNAKRAEALKIKLLYKWSFPMRYEDVLTAVYESGPFGYGYSPTGYPMAGAILQRLQARCSPGTFTAQLPFPQALLNLTNARNAFMAATGSTPAQDLVRQNSACIAAVFDMTIGGSVDDLAPTEISTFPVGTAAVFDNNPVVIDAWGTPLFYMRYGNIVLDALTYNWIQAVLGPVGPVTTSTFAGGAPYPYDFAFHGIYYSQITDRAKLAFPAKWTQGTQQGVDVDDPESTLTLASWKNQNPASQYWSSPYWKILPPVFPPPPAIPTPPSNGNGPTSAFTQSFGYVMSSFGAANNPIGFPRMYAPLVVLSAGPDRVFSAFDATDTSKGWADNLDSYRMTTRLGNQQ